MEEQLFQITKTLALLDLAILLVASVIGVVAFSRAVPAWRFLGIYIWVVTATEIFSKLHLYKIIDIDSIYLYHVYTPLEFLALSLMYREFLQLKGLQRFWFTASVIVGSLMLVSYSMFLLIRGDQNPESFQLYHKVVSSGAMIAYSVWLFARMLRFPASYMEDYRSVLSLNSGVLIYFSGSFILFLLMSYLLFTSVFHNILLWFLNVLLVLFLHTICTFALWMSRPLPRKS